MSDVWTIFRGEEATRTGTLSDADGPVDLSQYDTVSVLISRSWTVTPEIDDFVIIDPNQVTNKGKFSFTFTALQALIAARSYLLSFKGMKAGVPTYYPLNRELKRTFGRLVVLDPLDM